MGTRRHLSVSVRGNLRKSDRQLVEDWAGEITDDSGRALRTTYDIRTFWMDQAFLGREVVPGCESKECPGFDHKSGCPGHETGDAP
jgi:hypothetical protein